TSPELAEAAARGACEQGADVVALGEIGTEMLYYAVGEHGYEGGIQVTASHNPRAYNGMKIVRRGARPVGGDTGLDKIKRFAEEGTPDGPDQPGTITQRDIYEASTSGCCASSIPRRSSRCRWCWTAPTGWPAP